MVTEKRGPRWVNKREILGVMRIAVMCPVCGASGAHEPETYQPKCHVCKEDVYMQPASNNRIECTWEEFKAFYDL